MISQRFVLSANFWSVCILFIACAVSYETSSNIRCIEKEKQALLEFKQGLADHSNILSSWSAENRDCCEWRGITCNNQTGGIIMLDLMERSLAGMINVSLLLELQYLSYLKLSYNDFHGGRIPNDIGRFSQLKELGLAQAGFVGPIPHQLGNLSDLQTLDLSRNNLTVDNLDWLSGLSSLSSLLLSDVNLSKVVNWPLSISKLPSLSELWLPACNLHDVNPESLPLITYPTSLRYLILSQNSLNASIFSWIVNFSSSLVDINLSRNQLKGPIPDVFSNMVSLLSLDLSYNQLEGGIPKSFQNLCSLMSLDLSSNRFSDRLHDSLKNLSCAENTLEFLYLSNNGFLGPFPDLTKYSTLRMLKVDNNTGLSLGGPLPKNLGQNNKLDSLSLVDNQLSGPLPDFTELSSLTSLFLKNNQLNGAIPKSMGKLSSLEMLDLSYNSLNGAVTEAHFSNLSRLWFLDISHNSFLSFNFNSGWIPPFQLDTLHMTSCNVGTFPIWLRTQRKLSTLDMANANISDAIPDWFWNNPSSPWYNLNLSFNQIHGKLPNLSSMNYLSGVIDLSSNHLSGPLPPFPPNTTFLRLSKNRFSGTLSFLCEMRHSVLIFLDLSDNRLSGELPNCWMQFKNLSFLNLANNHFSGKLPASLGYLPQIGVLHLRKNSFYGEMPSFQNCKYLSLLDLGENRISGKLPEWLAQGGEFLFVLRLSSNEFDGSIPTSWCSLQALQILDLSRNNLSGALPHCISNMTAMKSEVISFPRYDAVNITWKGIESEFGINLYLMRSIDISSNHLRGVIPDSITSLSKLNSLNLSCNNLTGRIPGDFDRLKDHLEILDLSRNRISGNIPPSFSTLHFLDHLNLSFNKLTGRIPTSIQLQSLQASAFMGNDGLFGPPLTENLPKPDNKNNKINKANEEGYITFGFYVSSTIGFIVGFWGFCGPLLLRSTWRLAYIRFWIRTKDWIYVKTRVFKARLLGKLTGNTL